MKKVFLLAIGTLIFASCNQTAEKSTTTTEEVVTHEGHDHDENSEAIKLNNTEKWVVNEEMKPHLMKGEQTVNSFIDSNSTDYAKLAADVKEQNNHLIKSCTMDGASHDELHKWLHPHLEITKKLAAETDPEKSKELVAELKTSYQVYHTYFN